MLLGAVSDVHCNAATLGLALAELDALGATTVLAGGDLVFEYRFSSEVVRMVREREMPAVAGNHEVVLLGPQGIRAREADHVDPAELAFMQTLPFVVRTEFGGRRLHLTHASPWAPHFDYLYPDSKRWDDVESLDADLVVDGPYPCAVRAAGRPHAAGESRARSGSYAALGARFTYAVIDTDTLDAEIRAVPG